jgi:hypothetical protein
MTNADPQHVTADVQSEVQRDIEGYNAAFVQANLKDDPTLMRPWMRVPVVRFGMTPEQSSTASTLDEVDAMYRRMVDGLKGTGYTRSVLSDFDITLLNPSTALVRCHAVREGTAGAVVQEFDAAYIMARGSDRWQVASLISQRPV